LYPHYEAKNRIIGKIISRPKGRVESRILLALGTKTTKIANLITKFIFQQYRFVALEEIDEEDLDKMLDKRYQPFLLQSDSLSTLDMIAVARKTTDNASRSD